MGVPMSKVAKDVCPTCKGELQENAKFCLEASTWGTKLSQIEKTKGAIYIMTKLLPNILSIEGILSKRPTNIFILAHDEAENNAKSIK